MHIAIIGNGIAGITAARHIRKLSDHRITVISDETEHFYSRTALMYLYMGHMAYENLKPYEDWFWEKNRIGLLRDYVNQINTAEKQLILRSGKRLDYDKLLIASGSKSNRLNVEGADLRGVQTLYGIPDLELMEEHTRNVQQAVVVGGGLIGVEMAEMQLSRKIAVTFLVREKEFYDLIFPNEEGSMISREIRRHGVDLRLETELAAIEGDEHGRVNAIRTNAGERISCGFVGIAVGVHPNLDVVKNSGIETGSGVLADTFLRTSVEDVYAAGDCVELRKPPPGHRAISPVWYTGAIMGRHVARVICGKKIPYDPGYYFNSAKFFGIEWQVYGHAPRTFEGGDASLFWQHPNGRQSVRLVYDAETTAITGFNILGQRYRQLVCEDWMTNKKTLKYVVEHLEACQFNPEFHEKHNEAIRLNYNKLFPDNPAEKHRRKIFRFF
ncbi:MAG: FAD-dependent oxidoreductase [Bacteroidia bacterium]